MNKEKFIKELSKATNLSEEKCTLINSILEDYFIIGKKNKEKIINDLISKLDISEQKANEIYECAVSIITTGIKERITHPFKD